jgi:NarL family two-component system response regulator LiaR
MVTVAIVDDDRLVCEHMQERLDRSDDLRCVGVAQLPGDARDLVRRTRPDLIVLDIILRDVPDPIELAEELVASSPRSRVVVCTTWSDNIKLDHEIEFRQKVRASRSGVISWISKGRGINEVVEELRRAAEWRARLDGPSPLEQALGTYLRTAGASFIEGPFRADAGLTPAEARVVAEVARGLMADMTVDEVARATRMVPGTIRGHLKSVYAKWQVHGQAAFVAEARRRGLLDES